jgi:hypothetical protein
MTLKLRRLTRSEIAEFVTSDRGIRKYDEVQNAFADQIEAQFATQQATIDRIRRVNSHTVPTTILHAADVGADVTITIDAHTRVLGDATSLAIAGGSVTGLAFSTVYAGYYDDATLESLTPTYHFTTDLKAAQTVAAEGRFFLGIITTPANGGCDGHGGGVYAAGSNVGGEL